MRQHKLRLAASVSTAALAEPMGFNLTGLDGISASEGLHVFVTHGDAFEVTAESDSAR